jgi:hypothetical protein
MRIMNDLSFMAFGVAYRRVGVVFIQQGKLTHWQISNAAAASTENIKKFTRGLIEEHGPHVVVTERITTRCRKGATSQALIAAIVSTSIEHKVLDVRIERTFEYANKYREAEMLVGRYPELTPWLPKPRRFYDNEPRNTVLFEALALAEAARRGPSTRLAAALG